MMLNNVFHEVTSTLHCHICCCLITTWIWCVWDNNGLLHQNLPVNNCVRGSVCMQAVDTDRNNREGCIVCIWLYFPKCKMNMEIMFKQHVFVSSTCTCFVFITETRCKNYHWEHVCRRSPENILWGKHVWFIPPPPPSKRVRIAVPFISIPFCGTFSIKFSTKWITPKTVIFTDISFRWQFSFCEIFCIW